MKTILVPTDFSECAEHALNYACYIAERTNSKIVLLHVLHPEEIETSFFSEGAWTGSWAGEKTDVAVPAMMGLLKLTKKKMSVLMDLPQCRKVPMIDFIEVGPTSRMINEAALRYNADLIVMGTHGASGLNELFLGTNAEEVARDAEVPVLTIKEGHDQPQIRSIAFATDFSAETDMVFPSVKAFADIFHAKVHLVKVMTSPTYRNHKATKRLLENFRQEAQADISTHIYYHDLKEVGIRHFADAIQADMIALGTHGRRGLARFFKGSIAKDLVNHSSVPVMTINFRKKKLEGPVEQKAFDPEEEIEENKIPETYVSGHVPSI